MTRHKNGAKQSRPLGRIIESRQDRLLFEQVSFLGFCGSPSLDRKPWARGPTTNDPCRGAFLFSSEPAGSFDLLVVVVVGAAYWEAVKTGLCELR